MGIEIIRLFQTPLIKYDENLYDKVSKKHVRVRTSELSEELGQVEHILSDKTGTLTQNNMVLEKITVSDKVFEINQVEKYFNLKYFQNESIDFRQGKYINLFRRL
jgi:magnesium-transporting ATPase (P-type)